jgi:hypothetical protein
MQPEPAPWSASQAGHRTTQTVALRGFDYSVGEGGAPFVPVARWLLRAMCRVVLRKIWFMCPLWIKKWLCISTLVWTIESLSKAKIHYFACVNHFSLH